MSGQRGRPVKNSEKALVVQQMIRALKSGVSQVDVAREFGRSRQAVHSLFNRHVRKMFR